MSTKIDDDIKKIDINEFLTIDGDPLTADKIVFLLGAGASIDAGIPHLKQVTEELEVYLKNLEGNDSELLKLYEYFRKESYSSKYSLNNTPNIENILALINDYIAIKEDRTIYNVIGIWDKELMELTNGKFDIVKELKNRIEWFFSNMLIWRKFNLQKNNFEVEITGDKPKVKVADLRYIYFIFYLQEQLKGDMKIFSLNHDMVIESAYNEMKEKELLKYIELECGISIEGKSKIFDISRYTKLEKTDKKSKPVGNMGICQLFKIHGSIDWERRVNENIISIMENYENAIPRNYDDPDEETDKGIIFGISQKFKSEEPYSTLYYRFKESILDEDVLFLIVVGYSFNDEHINDAIASALRSNKKLHIIIVDPHLCETSYYSYPVISDKNNKSELTENSRSKTESEKFISNIIKSREYESYLNMSFLLHSVYYSRNFEEDAIFLAYCVGKYNNESKNSPLSLTQAGKDNNYRFSYELLKSILDINDFRCSEKNEIYASLKEYFNKDVENGTMKGLRKKRNEDLYKLLNPAFGGRLEYNDVINLVSSIKVFLYDQQNGPATENPEYDKYVVGEILGEIRTIEQFVKHFIPVHLSLMFAMMESLEEIKNKDNEVRSNELKLNISITIYEMFLKFYYLIDTLVIKFSENSEGNTEFQELKELLNEKNPLYAETYEKILELDYKSFWKEGDNECNLKLRDKINELNSNLYRIRYGILQTSTFFMKGCHKNNYEFTKGGEDDNNIRLKKFDNFFLTVRSELEDELRDYKTLMKSILHILKPPERKMKLKVRLYSKAIVKSMISRIRHMQRLQRDYHRLLEQLQNDVNNKIRGERWKRREVPPEFRENVFIDPASINKEFLGAIFSDFEIEELKTKLDLNLNWYVERYGRIMAEFIDQSFVLRFDDPQRDYTNNLLLYLRLLNRNERKCELYRYIKNNGYKKLINRNNEISISNNDNIDKLGKGFFEKSETIWDKLIELQLKNRISFKHVPAEIFFSKELRPINLFKYYHLHFYQDAHVANFANTKRVIKDFTKYY